MGAGLGLYTWGWEPHSVEFVQWPMAVKNLPESLKGKTLVQLSDLHIGAQVDPNYVMETFDRVRELKADIVVVTGDWISYDSEVLAQVPQVLARMPLGRLATVAVLGNHDYGKNWRQPMVAEQVAQLVRQAGVNLLRNEVAEVEGLQIVGLDDLWAKQFEPAKVELKGGSAAVVLSHNPDTVDLPVWGDYDGWILSGHTHGGQCKPPFLPPPLLPVQNRLYTAGEFQLSGGRRLYINRGVGHLLQVRFNVRPEVTVFTLQQA